jgi:hypothetical protein
LQVIVFVVKFLINVRDDSVAIEAKPSFLCDLCGKPMGKRMGNLTIRISSALVVESMHLSGELLKRYDVAVPGWVLNASECAFWIALVLIVWALLPVFGTLLLNVGNIIIAIRAFIDRWFGWAIRHIGAQMIRRFRPKSRQKD